VVIGIERTLLSFRKLQRCFNLNQEHGTKTRQILNYTTTCDDNCFILSGAISNCPLLFLSSILDTYCPGGSSCGVISFCLVILSIGFSSQEYWSRLPFPSPVDHILSELFTMTHLSWVVLHGMTHSFIEL